jgi:hypothetical protein
VVVKTDGSAVSEAGGQFCLAGEAVMLEGIVEKVGDRKNVQQVATVYFKKYDFDFSKMNEPIFVVRPRVAFGQIEKTFVKTATRWKFD